LRFIPHEYQKKAIEHILRHPKCALFLEMGLGKTVITLTALTQIQRNKALVIAPKRVVYTWQTEVQKWEHTKDLTVSAIVGTPSQRKKALERDADLYLIGRDNVSWLADYYKKRWPFDVVIIDELSSFKNPRSIRFRSFRRVLPYVKRLIGLTGTPAPNSLIDLWAQLYLLDKGERLGKTLTGYRERYFLPDKRNQHIVYSWKLKPGADQAIHSKLSDICISMKADDWLDLPERITNEIRVALPMTIKEKYRQLEKELLLPFSNGDVVANTAATLSSKLLQMANGAVYDENGEVQSIHEEKLNALEDLIEAANGEPVLVFYSYKHDFQRIKERFPKAKTLESSEDIERWNRREIDILLAHPASAGHGLNLQAGGHIVVWFGLTWSRELYEQANARLDRQGQKQRVIVHHLICEGTMDEQVLKALERKGSTQTALMDAVKAKITHYQEGA
jgi:SNF2 family DNA or RNA helicase